MCLLFRRCCILISHVRLQSRHLSGESVTFVCIYFVLNAGMRYTDSSLRNRKIQFIFIRPLKVIIFKPVYAAKKEINSKR